LVVLNTTRDDARGLSATTRVVSLDNRELFARTDRVDAPANRATQLPPVPLDTLFARDPMVLVSLRLTDAAGKLVSENFYWRGKDTAAYRALDALEQVKLTAAAQPASFDGKDRVLRVMLSNPTATPALNAKLTLVDQRGERILPAFYSDNYVALLPGESKTIEVRYPANARDTPRFTLRGWNVAEQSFGAQP
ncbi:MAG TPA: glycoside hydrolase family 2, partial [Sphingomonas sp.]|nr:glycoside hydrolase family 2 [Sphingomonas sp.]